MVTKDIVGIRIPVLGEFQYALMVRLSPLPLQISWQKIGFGNFPRSQLPRAANGVMMKVKNFSQQPVSSQVFDDLPDTEGSLLCYCYYPLEGKLLGKKQPLKDCPFSKLRE